MELWWGSKTDHVVKENEDTFLWEKDDSGHIIVLIKVFERNIHLEGDLDSIYEQNN